MRVCLGSARCAGRNGGPPENGELSERPVAEGRAKLRIVRNGPPPDALGCSSRRSGRSDGLSERLHCLSMKIVLLGCGDCVARVCVEVLIAMVCHTGRAAARRTWACRLPCCGPAGVGLWRGCRRGQACACSPGAVWSPAAASVGRGICFRFIVDIVKTSRKEWFSFEPCRSTLDVCFM